VSGRKLGRISVDDEHLVVGGAHGEGRPPHPPLRRESRPPQPGLELRFLQPIQGSLRSSSIHQTV
jgi:hypothetical protein